MFESLEASDFGKIFASLNKLEDKSYRAKLTNIVYFWDFDDCGARDDFLKCALKKSGRALAKVLKEDIENFKKLY